MGAHNSMLVTQISDLENFVERIISHKHEDEYLVTDNEEPRSTSLSPLEI